MNSDIEKELVTILKNYFVDFPITIDKTEEMKYLHRFKTAPDKWQELPKILQEMGLPEKQIEKDIPQLKKRLENHKNIQDTQTNNVYDALTRGIPEIKYILNPFLRKGGLTIVAGEPATRKSLFVQLISIAIVKGKILFEKFDIEQKKVLWIDFENGLVVLLNRYQSLLHGNYSGNKNDLRNLYYSISPAFKLDNAETIVMLKTMIEETKADVIIIDPFIAAISGDENKSQDVRRCLDHIKPLMEEGKSFIIIHHIGKDAQKRGLNALRGSSDLGGMAEVVLLLTKNGNFTNVEVTKHRHLGTEAVEKFGFLIDNKTFGENSNYLKITYSKNLPQNEDAITSCYHDFLDWIDKNYKTGDIFLTKKMNEDLDKIGHKDWAIKEARKKLIDDKIIKKTEKQGKWEVL